MLKAVLERVILFFVPIALGYLWRLATERRAGARQAEAPPPMATQGGPDRRRFWLWLAAIGALLVAASLVIGPLLPHAPDRSVYVPGQVGPNGQVSEGHFEPAGNTAR